MTNNEEIAQIAIRVKIDRRISPHDADVLFSTISELKASNQMAAEHMARDREYAARLQAELDSLKNSLRPELICGFDWNLKKLEDYIQMRCQRGCWQSYADLEAERNRLLNTIHRVVKAAQSVMPEGKP